MKIDYVNFYSNFVNLCKEKGLKPSRAGIEAGIPKQTEEKEIATALNDKVEAIMKVYDMLTPENKERFSDSLSEILSALIKEQLQG